MPEGVLVFRSGPMGDWKLLQTLGDKPLNELVDGVCPRQPHAAQKYNPVLIRNCGALPQMFTLLVIMLFRVCSEGICGLSRVPGDNDLFFSGTC